METLSIASHMGIYYRKTIICSHLVSLSSYAFTHLVLASAILLLLKNAEGTCCHSLLLFLCFVCVLLINVFR